MRKYISICKAMEYLRIFGYFLHDVGWHLKALVIVEEVNI